MLSLKKFVLPLMAGLLLIGGTAAADDSIFDIRLNIPVGSDVTTEDVVVTAVGRFGFFIQEPDPDGTWGYQFSGIWVYTNVIPSARRGDLVNVTGTYEDYFGLAEIDVTNGGNVTITGQGTIPDPILLTISECNTTGALAENYEGVLIRVDRDDDTLLSYPPDNFNEWWLKNGVGEDSLKMESYSALPGGDFEYDIPDSASILSFAQGILTFSFDEFKLAPRNCEEDLGTECKPRLRGAYATSPTGVAVQFGVPVDVESAENIANYELLSGLSVLAADLDEEFPKRVFLTTDDLGNAEEEEVTVDNVLSAQGVPMSGPESAPFRTGFTPIREIQFVSNPGSSDPSPMVGEIVTVLGRLTGLDGTNYYYLQDDDGGPWDGLYCRVARSSPYDVGREVLIVGRVNEYFGMTQLSYASGHDYQVDRGYNSPVTVNTITCSDLPYRNDPDSAEQWEDCLVRMEGARIDSLSGIVGPYFSEWLLFQTGDPDTSKMDFDAINGEKAYDACVDDEINVTGLVGYAFSQYQIWPRTGRGIDIEVIFDNPACAPTAVEDLDGVDRFPNLRTEPNPFNPRTTIRFRLPSPDQVRLEIVDPAGRLVRTLVNDAMIDAGPVSVIWDGRDEQGHPVGSGTYFTRLITMQGFAGSKMVLLK